MAIVREVVRHTVTDTGSETYIHPHITEDDVVDLLTELLKQFDGEQIPDIIERALMERSSFPDP